MLRETVQGTFRCSYHPREDLFLLGPFLLSFKIFIYIFLPKYLCIAKDISGQKTIHLKNGNIFKYPYKRANLIVLPLVVSIAFTLLPVCFFLNFTLKSRSDMIKRIPQFNWYIEECNCK